jgi:hypothetical protein
MIQASAAFRFVDRASHPAFRVSKPVEAQRVNGRKTTDPDGPLRSPIFSRRDWTIKVPTP